MPTNAATNRMHAIATVTTKWYARIEDEFGAKHGERAEEYRRIMRESGNLATGSAQQASANYRFAMKRLEDLSREFQADFFATHRDEIAADIRTLLPLGRTMRWQSAVLTWATEMESEEVASLSWAFGQYSIYAGHAAE